MKATRSGILAAVAVLALTPLASCGDGEEASPQVATQQQPAALPAEVVAQANQNCRQMLRDVKRAGREAAAASYSDTLELATEGFAEPGLRLTKRLAERQRALVPTAGDARFNLYVELFDPIIVLGEQGLAAGRADDRTRSEELRDLLTGLGEEQRQAAGRAGLRDCSVDFLDALVRGATG